MINAALETLAQLLESPDENFIKALTSERGILTSKIIATENNARISLGHMSASTTTVSGEMNSGTDARFLLFEPDISEIHPKVEKWISESITYSGDETTAITESHSEIESSLAGHRSLDSRYTHLNILFSV